MKILVIEDEKKLCSYLSQGLSESGFVVDLAHTAMDGHHLAMTQTYDLIILDISLPDMDGRRVLQSLRQAGSSVPVMFLTAFDSVGDRVKGLELGADDYLAKPFAFAELLARVRTLLRRATGTMVETELVVKDLSIDIVRRRASRSGRRISLTPKEFSLLELLVRHKDEVLPRSLIASQVWDMNFDGNSNVIDVAIRRLRSKIDDPFEQKLIQTVRGIGYMLESTDTQ